MQFRIPAYLTLTQCQELRERLDKRSDRCYWQGRHLTSFIMNVMANRLTTRIEFLGTFNN